MPQLGRYRFSFDTWKILEVEEDYLEESEEIEDPEIETKEWRPMSGKPCEGISLVFVDGVRRTEHLIYVEDEDGNFTEGAFVSVGAGALFMRHSRINPASEAFQDFSVKRFLLMRREFELPQDRLTFEFGSSTLEFEVVYTEKELSPFVNELMAKMESQVAESAYRRLKPDLMITDGTVHHGAKVKGLPFVGYIKKHRKRYVPNEKTYIFRELKLGERTPIVRVHSQPTMEGEGAKSFDKFTWYVRISEHEGISGIARLEVSAGVSLSRAKELADMTAWIIPKFASAEFSDRRAPHNLTPIKHLENALRRRLGSQAIIRRVLLKEFLTNR
ncbi:DNA double-strand break repair nuclease NurA [Hydrogenivirga sp.]